MLRCDCWENTAWKFQEQLDCGLAENHGLKDRMSKEGRCKPLKWSCTEPRKAKTDEEVFRKGDAVLSVFKP